MATYQDNLLPSATGFDLGSASQRWYDFVQNLDLSGTTTITGRFGVKNLEDVRFADQFTGTVTQMLDGAITDVVTGLVIAPSTMGAGSPTSLNSSQYLLDLRSGVFKLYCGNTSTPQLNITSGGVAAQVFTGSNANPASAGLFRLAKIDALNFRNNANSADIAGLQLDSSNVVQVGDTAGAKTVGPLAIAGALTGVTNLSYSGQIASSVATGTAPFSVTSATVVPTLNVATLNGVTVSGVPTTGQSLVATSASAASWSSASGVKVESAQSTPVTISSISGATTMMSFLLPANELSASQCLRIIAHGTSANTSGLADNDTFTCTVGANTAFTAGTVAPNPNGTTAGWRMELLLTCTTSGSSGTIECSGWMININTTPTITHNVSKLTATIAIDTTSSNTIAIKGNATINDVNKSITQRQLLIERVG